jgi:hypothetical protein
LILSLANPDLAQEAGEFRLKSWRTKIDINGDLVEGGVINQKALEKALFRQMNAPSPERLDVQLTLALPEGLTLGPVAKSSPYKRASILILTALGGVRLSLQDFESLVRLARALALQA